MPEPTGPTQVITFYSFKGGVGRTMALVNTAHVLAQEGWRVLIVDCDLEAPGMTHFFARHVRWRPAEVQRDALDLLLEAKRTLAEADRRQDKPLYPRSLAEYVVPIPLPGDWLETPATGISYRNGRLDLIPATLEPLPHAGSAAPPPDYLERLAELDLSGLFAPSGPGHRFGDHVRKYFVSARFTAPGDILFALRETVHAAYDLVLIDSRTGLNELAGFSIGTVADALVLCCSLNKQNVEGTRYFMRKTGLHDRDKAKPFLVAAGPVPSWSKVEDRLRELPGELHIDDDDSKPIVPIPYHALAALEETVFVTKLPDENISRQYRRLAVELTSRLLPRACEGGVTTACKIPQLRLLHSQAAPTLTCPTECGVTSLPSRNESRWEQLALIPLAAAISAQRLSSDAPFKRAWGLLPTVSGDDYQVLLSRGLSYFQSLVQYPLPQGFWKTNLRERHDDDDFSVLTYLSTKTAQRTLSFYSRRRLEEAGLSFDCNRTIELRSGVSNFLSKWILRPIVGGDMLERLLLSVAKLTRGDLFGDPNSQQFLATLFHLPGSPDEVLQGSSGISFDRTTFAYTPLGFWQEPLAATGVALWKGPDAIKEILAWLHLARLHYGCAWRMLIAWRYFESVKEHPDFMAFLREEDEAIEEIEAAVDRGDIPL